MGTSELRHEVEKFIKNADTRFLKMVHALAVTYSKKEIVAYTTTGIPLSKEDYIKEIEKGEDDIKNGRVLTTEELVNKIKSPK